MCVCVFFFAPCKRFWLDGVLERSSSRVLSNNKSDVNGSFRRSSLEISISQNALWEKPTKKRRKIHYNLRNNDFQLIDLHFPL